MKKFLCMLLAGCMLMGATACQKKEETKTPEKSEIIEKTPEESEIIEKTPEEPELTPEELEALKEEDYDAMITLLIDAETVNSKIGDAVNAYNDGSADEAKTIETLKSLSEEFATVKTLFDETEWKTDEYIEKAKLLETALNGLDEFFTLVIEGLEDEDYDKQDKAFESRQIYYDNSNTVYEWFKQQ